MSYQEIYKGMVKQASAEQVKELAGMIKSARMNKEAAPSAPGVWPLLKGFFTGTTKYFPYGAAGSPAFKKQIVSIPNLSKATLTHVKNHPYIYGGIGGGTGLFGSGILLGNIGKSNLREELAKAQKTSDKLLAQNKNLKNQSGWAKLWQDLKKWWDSIWENKSTQSK